MDISQGREGFRATTPCNFVRWRIGMTRCGCSFAESIEEACSLPSNVTLSSVTGFEELPAGKGLRDVVRIQGRETMLVPEEDVGGGCKNCLI